MLKAVNLTKTYNNGKKIALRDFSMKISKGSIYGLLGPNGTGKTSFIRIINQIIKQDSGNIFFDGEKLSPKHIKEIGYMPEERGLYKNMPINEQLIYLGQIKGLTKNECTSQIKFWFKELNIENWEKKKISELSKGMAQKIQFIVTVLHRPKFLILDEPFSGFDPINADLIKDKIINLNKNGTTIILSTHQMNSVEEICDYMSLINNSKKILDGKISYIKDQFKQNLFNVTLDNFKSLELENIKSEYFLENLEIKGNTISFQIRNKEYINSNILLQNLLKIGDVRCFEEKVPSINDIFIKSIKNYEKCVVGS